MSDASSIQTPTALPVDGIHIAGTPTAQQVAMTLSAIAYAPGGDVTPYLGSSSYLAADWSLSWGPASSPSNLAYGAYNATTNTFALVIRGADVCDAREVFDVCNRASWMYPEDAGARISQGASDALNDVLSLQSADGFTLVDWIATTVPLTSPDVTLWVTGHSLGGMIASMVAPYLTNWYSVVNPLLQVYTFAAPTAGDATFAALAAAAGSTSQRVFNNLDGVPMAFDDLECARDMYEPTYPCPDLVKLWIDHTIDCIGQDPYVQPDAAVTMLESTLTSGSDYLAEASYQHHHNTYLELLGAPQLPF
jgi:Lipase (class 3)